jgi:peptidoglycan/LPS O-acetylase OafA/YrhL
VSSELPHVVARSADTAELHAPVPTLLLELQTLLGTLAATVASETDRGRKPFRPGTEWSQRLGDLAYGVYLLADQTGVDVAQAVQATASRIVDAPRPVGRNGAAQSSDFFDRA